MSIGMPWPFQPPACQQPPAWWTYTTTTNYACVPAPVSEDAIRRIVREEMADLVTPTVPSTPPEDWS